jgi:hypothetical protein
VPITGAFSVFLSLLKVGILGSVEKGAAPLCQIAEGFFKSCFPWSNGLSGAGRISEVVSEKTGL